MNLSATAQRVRDGETVTCRPRGHSMRPLICSGDEVKVAPANTEALERDDIVLVRVGRSTYLHKVVAKEAGRVQIGNNHGRVNGWTDLSNVAGICIEIDGVPRPRLRGKVRGG